MAYAIVGLTQNTPEWHEFRKGKLGSSHASSLMGTGFLTPLQVFEEIMFNKKKKASFAMERGSRMEPLARDWVNKTYGYNFVPVVIQSLEHPELIASLDGYEFRDGNDYLLEIKCPGKQDHETALAGKVPEKYIPQLQHDMMLADVDWMFYCSYDGKNNVLLKVERDKAFCKKLLKVELDFLDRLHDCRPPDPIEDDWHLVTDGEKIVKAERYRELSLLMKELKTEMDDIREFLIKDLPHTHCKIGAVNAEMITRKAPVNYKEIDVLKDVDLEKYRKAPISYWTIS